jgi:hypothetical protein
MCDHDAPTPTTCLSIPRLRGYCGRCSWRRCTDLVAVFVKREPEHASVVEIDRGIGQHVDARRVFERPASVQPVLARHMSGTGLHGQQTGRRAL